MTATTTTRIVEWFGGIHQRGPSVPVAASTKIPAGVLVMIDSAGYATNPGSSVTNRGVAGVSVAEADNSSGSAGAINVGLAWGVIKMGGSSLALANQFQRHYATDNQTIAPTNAGNRPVVGPMVKYISATEGWFLVHGGVTAGLPA